MRCARRAGWEVIEVPNEVYDAIIKALVEKIKRLELDNYMIKYDLENLKKEKELEEK